MARWQNLAGTTETSFRVGKNRAVLSAALVTGLYTYTLPDNGGTFALLEEAQTFTAAQRWDHNNSFNGNASNSTAMYWQGTPGIGTDTRSQHAAHVLPTTAVTSHVDFDADSTTTAASFTLADLIGFRARAVTKGAGSTVTRRTGLYIENLTAGTTNYGVRNVMTAGAAKWGLYFDGGAKSHHAGSFIIGSTTDTGEALQVTGTSIFSSTATFTASPVFTNQSGTRTALGLGTAAVENIATSGANVGRLNANNTYAGDNIFSGSNIFTGGNTMRQILRNTSAGNSSIGQTAPGLLLHAAQHSTTNKYSPGIWWGSSDTDFTTTNPKLLAGVVGYATENYTADTHGGMGLEFFGMGNGPGTAPSPTSLGTATVANGWSIALASTATAVTQSLNDNSTKIATTAYADAAVSAVSALEYLGTTTLGSAQTTMAISGLDLDAHGHYIVQAEIGNATGSALVLSLFYNADTTATNYDIQATTSTGTGTSAGRANTAGFMACGASATASIVLNITKAHGSRVSAVASARLNHTTAIEMRHCAHLWRTTSTNVTGATISSSVATSINSNSFIRVWKLTT